MKVIDILNKIANGEEVRFRIIEDDRIFHCNKDEYIVVEKTGSEANWYIDENLLNEEVEIVEDKKIEKIERYHQYDECWVKDKFCQDQKGNLVDEIIIDKINEIIDYINKEN